MATKQNFLETIQNGYTFKGESIILGGGIFNGETIEGTTVKVPLKTLNRHGLIAGATGTGKTKTLQVITEHLSEAGVPVLLMDIKGDLSGLAKKGKTHPKIDERDEKIGVKTAFRGFPVELLTLTGKNGSQLRATVSEFGPVLFSKILGLNATQSSIMSILFKYCDDKKMPLLDLKDVKKVLQYSQDEGKEEIQKEYGQIASSSVSAIMRNIIDLEQQGADIFFGELSFDVDDLMQTTRNGDGQISIIRLDDIQDKPRLFSTFMLCLLAEIYNTLPEAGDTDKPKLVVFIDEAHLVFEEASKALQDQLEAIIKLIRSKGVGIFFCTQNPDDVPADILSQLGLKVQHALRAFTARDRKALKQAAQNYPETDFYDTEETLTQLGIGEALITALNEKGVPTPLVATLMRAPMSRMDILSQEEIDELIFASALAEKYNKAIDRESAYELLNEKIEEAQSLEKQEELKKQQEKEVVERSRREKNDPTLLETLSKNTMVRQVGRTLVREITRGIFGALGLGGSSSRRRTTSRRSTSRQKRR